MPDDNVRINSLLGRALTPAEQAAVDQFMNPLVTAADQQPPRPGGFIYSGVEPRYMGIDSGWPQLRTTRTQVDQNQIRDRNVLLQGTEDMPKPPLMPPQPIKSADGEEWYNRKLVNLIPFRGGRKKGGIGLEIEVEGKQLFNAPMSWWTVHSDGSLRETEGHQPLEYVLKEPLSIDDTTKALEYLESQLKSSGSQIVQSTRTSVHVHVNCQDLTVRKLYNFICLYLIFEEALVDWSGPERAGNLFCLRAKDSDFFIQMLESTLKEESFREWKEEVRYLACNVVSIPKFGSLEFRSMRGTVDKKVILTWVQMLINLRKKAVIFDKPTDIVDRFIELGPLPFFRFIFDDPELRAELETVESLSAKFWSGLRMMRDVAFSSDWNPPKPRKEGEIETQGLIRYWSGQELIIGGRSYFVEARYAGEDSAWRVRDFDPVTNLIVGESHRWVQPTNTTIFKINDPEGNFVVLEVRPGDHRAQ